MYHQKVIIVCVNKEEFLEKINKLVEVSSCGQIDNQFKVIYLSTILFSFI